MATEGHRKRHRMTLCNCPQDSDRDFPSTANQIPFPPLSPPFCRIENRISLNSTMFVVIETQGFQRPSIKRTVRYFTRARNEDDLPLKTVVLRSRDTRSWNHNQSYIYNPRAEQKAFQNFRIKPADVTRIIISGELFPT